MAGKKILALTLTARGYLCHGICFFLLPSGAFGFIEIKLCSKALLQTMSWVGKSVLLPMSTCSVPLGLRGLKGIRLSKSGGINLKLAGSSLTQMALH